MRTHRLIFILGLLSLGASQVNAGEDTYESVLKGKQCKETSGQSIECDYRVGKTLHVVIAGIGQPDASITFMKSDFNGDYYASIGVLHGCVIVKRGPVGGMFDFAFISPHNGKVYKGWQECQSGM